jgi:hypothetical protein
MLVTQDGCECGSCLEKDLDKKALFDLRKEIEANVAEFLAHPTLQILRREAFEKEFSLKKITPLCALRATSRQPQA